MHKKLITVLVIVALVLVLLIAGAVGFLWYRDNHVFVEGKAYPIHAESLDLREESISFDHYDQLHKLLPDCEILWNVPFQNGSYSSDSASLTVTGLTDTDIGLMETYFQREADAITTGVLIVDIRHKPTANDLVMHDWFRQTGCPEIVVANKLDKLKKSQVEPALELIRETLELTERDTLIPFSAEKGSGKDELLRLLVDACRG